MAYVEPGPCSVPEQARPRGLEPEGIGDGHVSGERKDDEEGFSRAKDDKRERGHPDRTRYGLRRRSALLGTQFKDADSIAAVELARPSQGRLPSSITQPLLVLQ